MNWFLFERGNIVWGSKSCCGDVASSLDSDIIVVLGIADVSLHGFFRTTDTTAHGLTIVVPRITGLWVSSDEKDPDVKGVFFIEQLLGIGEDVREDTPENIKSALQWYRFSSIWNKSCDIDGQRWFKSEVYHKFKIHKWFLTAGNKIREAKFS